MWAGQFVNVIASVIGCRHALPAVNPIFLPLDVDCRERQLLDVTGFFSNRQVPARSPLAMTFGTKARVLIGCSGSRAPSRLHRARATSSATSSCWKIKEVRKHKEQASLTAHFGNGTPLRPRARRVVFTTPPSANPRQAGPSSLAARCVHHIGTRQNTFVVMHRSKNPASCDLPDPHAAKLKV